MKKLTRKQKIILTFIKEYKLEMCYSPSFRDISGAFNMSVKGAYDHCNALKKKGFIDWNKGIARSIIIYQSPTLR
jgi:repressor LexA